MTKKDYIKIGTALKNYIEKNKEMENSPDGWNENMYLLDEICYQFEMDNSKFNEIKFRQFVLNIK